MLMLAFQPYSLFSLRSPLSSLLRDDGCEFSSTAFRSLCERTWCTQPSPHPGRHHKKIVIVSLAHQQCNFCKAPTLIPLVTALSPALTLRLRSGVLQVGGADAQEREAAEGNVGQGGRRRGLGGRERRVLPVLGEQEVSAVRWLAHCVQRADGRQRWAAHCEARRAGEVVDSAVLTPASCSHSC